MPNNSAYRHEYLIALGANLPSSVGSPSNTLRAALDMLRDDDSDVGPVSGFYATPCYPPGAGPDYVNAAALVRSHLPPADFLTRLHEVEAHFGRERVTRWGMRTLDLDLLAEDQRILPDPETYRKWASLDADLQRQTAPNQLILPHPRLHERAFVLVPLADIAADWHHPVTGKTVAQMRDSLEREAIAGIVAL